MTRMQKWQSYRDEIAKQAIISDVTSAEDKKARLYKQEINKISPFILSSTSDAEVSLLKGVSKVEVNQTGISIKIADMFAAIEKAGNSINEDSVSTIFFNMEQETIVDKNKNDFKQKVFDDDKNYSMLKERTKPLVNTNKTHDDELIKSLDAEHKKFKAKAEKHTVDHVYTIDKNSQKQASHYVFVIAISVSLLMLAIVLSLFIARMVLR